jgi:2-hydroxychromene-2-carboxylate isomerase
MTTTLDFYFDFASPYGYLASTRIDEIAARHGRTVIWRPYMMGVAMKYTGSKPLTEPALIADYSRRDFARCARL